MKRNHKIWLGFSILFLFGLTLFAHIKLGEYAFDDAYIYFRIVENYLDIGVPHYNPGEAVKAGTSTGWVVLLSVVLWLTRQFSPSVSIIKVAEVVNTLTLISGAIVYTILLIRLSGEKRSLFIWMLFPAVYVFSLHQSSLGLMETPTALLLAGGGLLLYIHDQLLSFCLLGTAVYFRPEFAVLFILVLIHSILKKHHNYLKIIAFSFMGAFPFIIFDLLYYGTVVPNSIVAKASLYTLTPANTVSYFLSQLTSPFFLFPGYPIARPLYLFYLLFGGLFFIGIFLLRLKRRFKSHMLELRHEILLIILLWGVFTFGIYVAGRALIFPWYMPLILIPICLIYFEVIVDSPSRRSYVNTLVMSSLLFVLIFFVVFQISLGVVWNPALYAGFSEGARVRQYIQTGRELYDKFPDKELMAPEIGGLGYGFRGRIIDSSGLASPLAIDYHPLRVPEQRSNGGLGALPVALVESVQPYLIVSFDMFIEDFLKNSVASDYQQIVLPPFLPEDMERLKFQTPWGSYLPALWNIKDFYIFIRSE